MKYFSYVYHLAHTAYKNNSVQIRVSYCLQVRKLRLRRLGGLLRINKF